MIITNNSTNCARYDEKGSVQIWPGCKTVELGDGDEDDGVEVFDEEVVVIVIVVEAVCIIPFSIKFKWSKKLSTIKDFNGWRRFGTFVGIGVPAGVVPR